MARSIRTTTRMTQPPKGGRAAAQPVQTPAKAKAKPAKSAKVKTPTERPPVVSKDELRARVEKLERANATLRAKGREATRAAKAATARIAELEEEVAALERQVAIQAASAKRSAKRAASRTQRVIDPGDAVPPGVAVADPDALDQEAEQALENLEEHLGEVTASDRNEHESAD